MDGINRHLIAAFVRKGLTLLAGFLIGKGILDADESADSFADKYLEEVIGFVLLAGSAVWSVIYQRFVRYEVIPAALGLPAGSSKKQLEKALEAGSSPTVKQ